MAKPALRETRTDRLAAKLTELRNRMKLDSWNAYITEMQVPSDLYPAMMTQRTQLMPNPSAKSADEVEILYDIIATLIDTNAALREHTEQTAILVGEWTDAFKSLATLAQHISMFANLKQSDDDAEIERVEDWRGE
jgi:LmbE family N-acetylglucosaminyl deacetylase